MEQTCDNWIASLEETTLGQDKIPIMEEYCDSLDGWAVIYSFEPDNGYYTDLWCVSIWDESRDPVGAQCFIDVEPAVYWSTVKNVEREDWVMPERSPIL